VERVPEAIGGAVELPIERVTSGSLTDWSPVYDGVEAANCDAAIQVARLTGTASVTQWADQERPFALGGVNLPSQVPGFWNHTDGACAGNFTLTPATPRSRNTERTRAFVRRHRSRAAEGDGRDPLSPAAFVTYDAVRLLAQALHETGAHPAEETDELIEHLEGEFVHTHGTLTPALGFRGPDARYAHDPVWECMADCPGRHGDDDPRGPAGWPVVQQWRRGAGEASGGRREAVAPASAASADYRRPPWRR